MSTFWTIYLLSMILNIVVVRISIHMKMWEPSPAYMVLVFLPVANAVCSFLFLLIGLFALLYWIVNGTLDVDS
jgi:hypothetical protein